MHIGKHLAAPGGQGLRVGVEGQLGGVGLGDIADQVAGGIFFHVPRGQVDLIQIAA